MATARMDSLMRQVRRAVLRRDDGDRSDGQLLTSFIERNDAVAFEAIVRRHGPMVFGVCRRIVHDHHDAEDAFQATFLVLACKATSIRPREQVANWLHGVALRIALKAKSLSARRRGREMQVIDMPEPESVPHDEWSDLQPLLDRELNGLPEIYRLPILLCDLEGKSIKEATRQLGWPQGTLAGRLARGRKLLAKRLANRGVTLSAGLLAAVVSRHTASAAVPATLMNTTVETATQIAAGQATLAGLVPAKVAILTEGALRAMLLIKLKTLAVGLLVAFLIVVAGAFYQTNAAEQAKDDPKTKAAIAASTSVVPNPPKPRVERQYVITTSLLEAGVDQPKVIVCPKLTVNEGEPCHVGIDSGPRNLLEKVIADEKIQIGTFLDLRANRLEEKRVRVVLRLHRNELQESSVNAIRVVGSSVQAIEEVELKKTAKFVFQKDAKGAPLRWLEITVDEIVLEEERIAPPPVKATRP